MATTAEVAPAASQALTVLQRPDQATRLADSTIYLSEKSTIDDKVQRKSPSCWQDQLDLGQQPLSVENLGYGDWNPEQDPFPYYHRDCHGNDLDLHMEVKDLFGEDLSLRSPNDIRRTYLQLHRQS